MKTISERLRGPIKHPQQLMSQRIEAADKIEAQAAEIERLRASLAKIQFSFGACGDDADINGLGLYEFCNAVLNPNYYQDEQRFLPSECKISEREKGCPS